MSHHTILQIHKHMFLYFLNLFFTPARSPFFQAQHLVVKSDRRGPRVCFERDQAGEEQREVE